MNKPKKKRGRKPAPYGPRFYTGCGRPVRMRDGVELPCECKSCK